MFFSPLPSPPAFKLRDFLNIFSKVFRLIVEASADKQEPYMVSIMNSAKYFLMNHSFIRKAQHKK